MSVSPSEAEGATQCKELFPGGRWLETDAPPLEGAQFAGDPLPGDAASSGALAQSAPELEGQRSRPDRRQPAELDVRPDGDGLVPETLIVEDPGQDDATVERDGRHGRASPSHRRPTRPRPGSRL